MRCIKTIKYIYIQSKYIDENLAPEKKTRSLRPGEGRDPFGFEK